MQWYSAHQVAKLLNAATATIIGQIEDGALGAINIARANSKRRRWRISEKHLAEFEQRQKNKPATVAVEASRSRRPVQRPKRDFFSDAPVTQR